jgi:exopolyphosphatase / guanosine-5'-triphosphate,3'-diphosphate pyrophosphatase
LILACIDIGTNTTRLLVVDAAGGRLRELTAQRAFTRIGRSFTDDGAIPPGKIAETARVVASHSRMAREAGAERLVAVATAAIRTAANRDELAAAVERAGGTTLTILSGDEEARLCFLGAARTLTSPAEAPMAVLDVGGGSTEIAVGDPDGAADWTASFLVGSGVLADSYLHSDPPSMEELGALREHAENAFEGLDPPPVRSACAVGGTATSLRRLLGGELTVGTLERGIQMLSRTSIGDVASRFHLDPERVRLLPAGILLLQTLSERVGRPLQIANGGLREGLLLELLEGREPG